LRTQGDSLMNALVPVNAAPAFTVSDVERVANAIAKGGLFGSKDPNAVLTLCLLAQAEGQHPAVVFRDYHIISGKPAKKAEAMLRDFINSGGKVKWHTLDDTCADATFTHPSGEARIEWTIERAKKAGISTQMWTKYPRQMLRSRVISEGVRTVFPGATSGLYVPEEVETFDGPTTEDGGTIKAVLDEPSPEMPGATKVVGIMKIKTSVREMQARGNDAADLAAFNAIVAEYAEPCSALAEARHTWWTGKTRDGDEFESIPAWIARRRGELSSDDNAVVTGLIQSMKQCETSLSLTNWRAANEDVIDALDGAEGRRFELAWNFHESAIREVEKVHN
jgi:hypothetical protein